MSYAAAALVETRKRLAVSASGALVGVALSVAVDPDLGGWVTVLAVAALVASLHRFGRSGPG